MTSLRAINGLFDDVDHQCHETHMMARVAAPGYLAVTMEDRELLSFLVSSLVVCARNMKADFKKSWNPSPARDLVAKFATVVSREKH